MSSNSRTHGGISSTVSSLPSQAKEQFFTTLVFLSILTGFVAVSSALGLLCVLVGGSILQASGWSLIQPLTYHDMVQMGAVGGVLSYGILIFTMQLRVFEILQTHEEASSSLIWTIVVMLYNKALALAFGAIAGTIGYLCFQPHPAPLHSAAVSGVIGGLVFVTATTLVQTVWLSFWSVTLPKGMKFEPWLPLPYHLALIADCVPPIQQQQQQQPPLQQPQVTRYMVEKKPSKKTDSTSSFTGSSSSSSSHQGYSHSATNSSPSEAGTAVSAYRAAAQQPNTSDAAPPPLPPVPAMPARAQAMPIAPGRKRGEPDYEKMPDLWDGHAQA